MEGVAEQHAHPYGSVVYPDSRSSATLLCPLRSLVVSPSRMNDCGRIIKKEGADESSLTCEWFSSNLRTHLIATLEFALLSIALYTFEKAPLKEGRRVRE